MKVLTPENWLTPDETSLLLCNKLTADGFSWMTPEEWLSIVLEPKSSQKVPENVQTLLDVARSTMIYGYFYYPIYTLVHEHLFRIAECAISAKHELTGGPLIDEKGKTVGFAAKLRWLKNCKNLSEDQFNEWNKIRRMRNHVSHLKQQSLLTPGVVFYDLEKMINRINVLFD